MATTSGRGSVEIPPSAMPCQDTGAVVAVDIVQPAPTMLQPVSSRLGHTATRAHDTSQVDGVDAPGIGNFDVASEVSEKSLPQNWSSLRRWLIILALSFTSLMV